MKVSRIVPVVIVLALLGCGRSASPSDVGFTTTSRVTLASSSASTTAPATTAVPPQDSDSTAPLVATTQQSVESTTTINPTTAGSAVTTFQAIAGNYESADAGGAGFLWIIDDETLMWALDESGQQIEFTASFRGTSVLLTDPDCGHDVAGEYEFRHTEEGQLTVALVDDPCPGRAGLLPGLYIEKE